MIFRSTPMTRLPRIGAATAKKFAALGISTVGDLLEHFPFRYEDYSTQAPIRTLREGQSVSVRGTVKSISSRKSLSSRVNVTEAMVTDGTGMLSVIWFNQPYIENYISVGDSILLSGTVTARGMKLQLVSPLYQVIPEDDDREIVGEILPIYPTTEGLTQKQIRTAVGNALPAVKEYTDWLPEPVRTAHQLLPRTDAIAAVHQPATSEALALGRRRLQFEELFLLQSRTYLAKQELATVRAPQMAFPEGKIKEFVASLPFTLTDDQRRAAWAVCQDLEKEMPMNRLLEGDVGSGKTAVAAIGLYMTTVAGLQGVLMAPTEILAYQHFQTLARMYSGVPVRVALLTHSYAMLSGMDSSSRADVLAAIESGTANVIIGTHALIQEAVQYKTIGLIVVDEQHRFGVKQRSALKEKNPDNLVPHFLSMTATPIPRSLALIVYGELELSQLRQMPTGRKPIKTQVVEERGRAKAYEFIAGQLREGRQTFVICPLIDPSDTLGVASVTEEYERLSKTIFKTFSVGLLHGKLKAADKDKIMRDFRDNKIQLLVSTSVIEVGIDIPNATVMMIEGADRFGLAQLHQFRGRVGRSEHQSYCFLFTDAESPIAVERLRVVERSQDGFAIAEADLKHRGPGEVYGVRQSGIPELSMASLTDTALIEETKAAVADFFANTSIEKYPEFEARLQNQQGSVHLE